MLESMIGKVYQGRQQALEAVCEVMASEHGIELTYKTGRTMELYFANTNQLAYFANFYRWEDGMEIKALTRFTVSSNMPTQEISFVNKR